MGANVQYHARPCEPPPCASPWKSHATDLRMLSGAATGRDYKSVDVIPDGTPKEIRSYGLKLELEYIKTKHEL